MIALGRSNRQIADVLSISERTVESHVTAILTTPFAGRVTVLGSRGWLEIRDRNHPEQPMGWDVVTVQRGSEPVTEFFPPHPSVRDNIEEFARAAGMPGVFGMGLLHGGVLAQRLTAWVGLANIRSFRIRFTGQVWPGDLLSFGGRVTGVREAGGQQVADLELVVTRQSGEPAIKGSAVVQVAR